MSDRAVADMLEERNRQRYLIRQPYLARIRREREESIPSTTRRAQRGDGSSLSRRDPMPVLLPMPEHKEPPAQQRVIDQVTIHIDEHTALIPSDPSDEGLCRFYIGDQGYGNTLKRPPSCMGANCLARATSSEWSGDDGPASSAKSWRCPALSQSELEAI